MDAICVHMGFKVVITAIQSGQLSHLQSECSRNVGAHAQHCCGKVVKGCASVVGRESSHQSPSAECQGVQQVLERVMPMEMLCMHKRVFRW